MKWRNLSLLALAVLLAMSVWFSGSAVVPQLTLEWQLDDSQRSWMTMSVQIGFVAGALLLAFLNLPDRISARHLFSSGAAAAALFNALIPLTDPGPNLTLLLRFLTGASLAAVYPPGMKLVATWCLRDRGLGIGILVGALTLGSAVPHLLNAFPLLGPGGMPPWRAVLLLSSALSLAASALGAFMIRSGPHLSRPAPFNWRLAAQGLVNKPTRLANFGYLGHMWELYAMWAWTPAFLIAAYTEAGWRLESARFAGFGVIAVGAAGCLAAGVLADRVGRTTITIWSLAVSAGCALTAGFFFQSPGVLTALCLIWGLAVVADSAQFSAAISELADSRYVGTALTVQTSLGFLLTLFTIRIVPPLVQRYGWEWAFCVLAVGPVLGIWSMLKLRRLPEASRMASGKR